MIHSRDLDDLEPTTRELAERLLQIAVENGYQPHVTSTYRDVPEQHRLFSLGRSAPGQKVTNADGCISWHTHRRAFDVVLYRPGDKPGVDDPVQGTAPYRALADTWEAWGGKWGGDFQDWGHYEYHPGVSIGEVCPMGPDSIPEPFDSPMPPGARPGSTGNALPLVLAGGVLAYLLARGRRKRNG